jgi:hypothetical protein
MLSMNQADMKYKRLGSMEKSNNNDSKGLFSNVLGMAKKLSHVGLELVNQTKNNQVYKENMPVDTSKTIEGVAHNKTMFDIHNNENPQQILRNYLPSVTQQLLGKHYSALNSIAQVVSPQLSDKVSDYFFERLNDFTNQISSVDSVLDQAGIQDLEELTQDIDRSRRLSLALVEQNKWIASIQGVVTGATGVIGSSVDIPASIVLALKTIYQVGRSYGFELNEKDEQDIVQYIFKQINLGILAEKQTLLLGLRTISRMLHTHDVQQLQQLLGSSNDVEMLKTWLLNEQGDVKWGWLNHVPKLSALTKLSPVIGASISASYSWKLVEDVNEKAQDVFSNARGYIQSHKDVSLSILSAYEKSLQKAIQSAPQQLAQVHVDHDKVDDEKPVEALTFTAETPTLDVVKDVALDEKIADQSTATTVATALSETDITANADEQNKVENIKKPPVRKAPAKARAARKPSVKNVTKNPKVNITEK